jgi:glucan biosynthesis protein C
MERRRIRRHDIDWIRVLAVLLLVPFHSARLFNIDEPNVAEPFYVKGEALSWPLSHFIHFVEPWHMPLLFVVAGAASWFALGFRTGQQYATERFRRLLIPLLFGVLIVIPPQGFFARMSKFDYDESYLRFWPDFFGDWGDIEGYAGTFTPAHLWFILYLFVFSIVGLALLLYLRRGSGSRFLSLVADACQRPGAIFLFAVPLLATHYIAGDVDPNPFRYFLLFVVGYILVADKRFEKAIDRHKSAAVLLGVMSAVTLNAVWALDADLGGDYTPRAIGVASLYQLDGWLWIVAILGYGRRFLDVNNRALRYANEAAYPFYILHQTVIVAVGFYVLKWGVGVPAAYTLVLLFSLVTTLALYDLLARRVGVVRFLFGMKGRPAAPRPSQAPAM